MTFYNRNIKAELLGDIEAIRYGMTKIIASASTYSMSILTPYYLIFTGTTSGQRLKLPNAQTLNNGHTYYIINESTDIITIYYYDNTTELFKLNPETRTILILEDNTTTNGVWVYQQSTSATLSSTSFLSYYGGNANVGRILEYVPGEDTTDAPYLVVGDSAIVALSLGAGSAVTGTSTIGIFKLPDTTNPITTINLINQQSNSLIGLYVSVNNADELMVKVTAGTILKPYLTTYLVGR